MSFTPKEIVDRSQAIADELHAIYEGINNLPGKQFDRWITGEYKEGVENFSVKMTSPYSHTFSVSVKSRPKMILMIGYPQWVSGTISFADFAAANKSSTTHTAVWVDSNEGFLAGRSLASTNLTVQLTAVSDTSVTFKLSSYNVSDTSGSTRWYMAFAYRIYY